MNTCTHTQFCLLTSDISTFDVPMGKKCSKLFFPYHIILLIFIRKSVLVELVSQGWEAPDQINLEDLKHLKLPIHASGPSLKVLALVIMINSAQFLELMLPAPNSCIQLLPLEHLCLYSVHFIIP